VNEIFWRNKAEQNGTVEMAEGFWGVLIEIIGAMDRMDKINGEERDSN
jgi:hypothetical protein